MTSWASPTSCPEGQFYSCIVLAEIYDPFILLVMSITIICWIMGIIDWLEEKLEQKSQEKREWAEHTIIEKLTKKFRLRRKPKNIGELFDIAAKENKIEHVMIEYEKFINELPILIKEREKRGKGLERMAKADLKTEKKLRKKTQEDKNHSNSPISP